MADEYIDILNQEGTKINQVQLKSEAHQLGLWHASVHIWFFTKNKEVLLQKRAAQKDTYPNLWDISVAGHIGAGEEPKEAALRETEEELGIITSIESLEFITTYKASKNPTPKIIDNEFNHIYCCKFPYDGSALQLQKEEVAEVKLISIDALENALNDPYSSLNYVPHGAIYYDKIFSELRLRM